MRVLKFRAWDAFNAEMFPKKVNDDLLVKFFREVNRRRNRGNDIHIMQFTGLKDKNGKEIYEGDIVKTIYCDKPHHKGEVYFQSARLNWSVKHSAYASQDLYVYARSHWSVEVIGNIYESPELLSTEQKERALD